MRHAARVLRAPCGGRPATDDALALAEVRYLVEAKRVASRWHGCTVVARRLGPSSQERTIANRLLRKLRAEDSASKPISRLRRTATST